MTTLERLSESARSHTSVPVNIAEPWVSPSPTMNPTFTYRKIQLHLGSNNKIIAGIFQLPG